MLSIQAIKQGILIMICMIRMLCQKLIFKIVTFENRLLYRKINMK